MQGTIGIFEGTNSLIKYTLAGSLNSLQKISGSLSNGISMLTLDQDFQEQRRRFKLKKPNHILQGLHYGFN